jgi:hypothetical protein
VLSCACKIDKRRYGRLTSIARSVMVMPRMAGGSVNRPYLKTSMNKPQRTHLDELENQSIFIFREATKPEQDND